MKLVLALLLLTATAAQAQDGRVWTLSNDKALPDVALVYGVPNSDDAVVALRCPRGTGQITASFPVAPRLADRQENDVWVDKIGRPAPWLASVTLASGLASATLSGLDAAGRRAAAEAGLELAPVSLQQLIVRSTTTGEDLR